ncbi:MAG TPA: DUF434 domain-containing protein [Rhodothermales bacterium]
MPHRTRHRGPDPRDERLFSGAALFSLREAVADYSWLLSRGYSEAAGEAIVGDRYRLPQRVRIAMRRMACSDDALRRRKEHRIRTFEPGAELLIDGFNVLITLESALGGAVVLEGRDGCLRDLAGLRGSYRAVDETRPALEAAGRVLAQAGNPHATWIFDRPVSNSGRVAAIVRDVAAANGLNCDADVADAADALLAGATAVIATADSSILDRTGHWFNLARTVVEREVPEAWIVSPA